MAEEEAEFTERARAKILAKAKEKAEIARISDKARNKANFEENTRNNANLVNRAPVEASSRIRFSADIQGAKIKRAEA